MKLLLRHGSVYTSGAACTGAHHAWLARQHLPTPATRVAFHTEHETVLATPARRHRLDQAMTAMAADSQFTPVVHWECSLREMSTLTGFGMAVEIGDWHNLTSNTIRACPGLMRSEHSPGASKHKGRTPKTGNTLTPAGC
ncbi:hypothetical protein [Kocuria sediminis]|uniref:hypothetical protein n=1 Tax=Kocuria sediminis TaxID=1038857 RepID=UPI001F0F6A87|nr:hypothetical protein [Kocuria sediminis]